MSRTFDLIGIPFPGKHSAFSHDTKLLKRVTTIEGYVEIQHDLRVIKEELEGLKRLHDAGTAVFDVFGLPDYVFLDALAFSIIVKYARCFNRSKNRTVLNPQKVYRNAGLLEKHKKWDDYRDKFVAHQQSEWNRHVLHFLREGAVAPHPAGQSQRLIVATWLDWPELGSLVETALAYTKEEISGCCEVVAQSLTAEQAAVLEALSYEQAKELAIHPPFGRTTFQDRLGKDAT